MMNVKNVCLALMTIDGGTGRLTLMCEILKAKYPKGRIGKYTLKEFLLCHSLHGDSHWGAILDIMKINNLK